jgi:hypothetical protein
MPDDPSGFPSLVQARLARYYGIEPAPDIAPFVRPVDGERETLFIRESRDAFEMALHLPREAVEAGPRAGFDGVCQVVEGVSHFLYVAERARRQLPTTQLELELQAEVDKYVLLVFAERSFDAKRAAAVRSRLFERVEYAHAADTEAGVRYRMANDVAARFAGKLESSYARAGRFSELRVTLQRFYGVGQTDKLALARAA